MVSNNEMDGAIMKCSEEFADALIYAWNHDRTLAYAVLKASGHQMDVDVIATDEVWKSAIEKSGLPEGVYLRQRVRAWIANKFSKANNALWDGQQELAKKWMMSGKDYAINRNKTERTKDRAEYRDRMKGVYAISIRDRDKRHDWKTVK